jgi:hypothetical protein
MGEGSTGANFRSSSRCTPTEAGVTDPAVGPLGRWPAVPLKVLRARRGPSELSVNIRNLFNAKPNLGDIGYVGYAQYAAAGAAGALIPQVATLQPLTATIQYTRLF